MDKRRAGIIAARRIGVTVDEYHVRQEQGEKWCSGCRAWHPTADFTIDRSRSSGLASRCRVAVRKYNHAHFYRAVCERCQGPRHAMGGRFCRPCYQQRALENQWIRWTTRAQATLVRRKDKARSALRREQREAEVLLVQRHASLDAPRRDSRTLGAMLPSTHSPLDDLMQKELALRIMELTGCSSAEEIERLDEQTRVWFVHRLQEEGLTPRGITQEAREEARPKRKAKHRSPRMNGTERLMVDDIFAEARGHAKLMKIARKNEKRAKKQARRERLAA